MNITGYLEKTVDAKSKQRFVSERQRLAAAVQGVRQPQLRRGSAQVGPVPDSFDCRRCYARSVQAPDEFQVIRVVCVIMRHCFVFVAVFVVDLFLVVH